jgi:hypothetical protein
VLAVTPFTAPPQTFDGFNRDHDAAIISGLARAMSSGRLVCVGLTATAELDDGTASSVMLTCSRRSWLPSPTRTCARTPRCARPRWTGRH